MFFPLIKVSANMIQLLNKLQKIIKLTIGNQAAMFILTLRTDRQSEF